MTIQARLRCLLGRINTRELRLDVILPGRGSSQWSIHELGTDYGVRRTEAEVMIRECQGTYLNQAVVVPFVRRPKQSIPYLRAELSRHNLRDFFL
jgi:hypothetical protein